MSLILQELEVLPQGGRPLFGPLSLLLNPGERLGLAGPSGTGKSLLIQALFGVLPRGFSLRGSAAAWGVDLGSPSPGREALLGGRLGWVPQEPLAALHPRLTAAEHLTLLPSIKGKEAPASALRRLAPLLARLRLDGLQARRPLELSGGQRQRLCLAMALSTDPDLLILDEPTTALDPILQAEAADLLLGLQGERPFGWLWISHDRPLLKRVCDRMVRLPKAIPA